MPELKFILPYVIWILAGMVLLLIVSIFIIRMKNEMSKFFWSKAKRIIEGLVLARLFDDLSDLNEKPRHLWSLKIIRRIPAISNKLLEYILDLKKNLSGKERARLNTLLYDFGLTAEVIRKLKSWNWSVVAKGLNEIKEFQDVNLYDEVMPSLHSKNRKVKMAAYRALIRLLPASNLYFLRDTDLQLSELDQIQLYNELAKRKSEIPDLESLLYSKNTSVILFAIKMIGIFQYHAAAEKLTSLIRHSDELVAIESLRALKALDTVAVTDLLMFRLFMIDSVPLLIAYLDTLMTLSRGRKLPLVDAYKWHPDDRVKAIFKSNIRHLTDSNNLFSKAS